MAARKKSENKRLQNIEAERSVIGAIINQAMPVDEILQLISHEAFSDANHQEIFKVAVRLYREGKAPDEINLSEHFENNQLLSSLSTIFFPESCREHLNSLHDLFVRRQVQQKCMELFEAMQSKGRGASSLLDEAQKALSQISLNSTQEAGTDLRSALFEVIDEIENKPKDNLSGLPTGYRFLDYLMTGLQPSNLSILAARPRVGKTALASNILINVAAHGYPCAIFSLEMSKSQLIKRMLSQISKVEFQKIRTGNLSQSDIDALHVGAEKLYKLDVWIDDSPGLTSYEIKSRARLLKNKLDIQLVAIDYLQKCKPNRRAETRDQAVTEMAADFKDLAKELNVPVLCLAQLNRQVENRKKQRPILSDLRESGGIEQEADDILFIYREAVHKENCGHNKAEVIIGKQRNGPEGTVDLYWNGDCVSFEELAREGEYASSEY